jgi:hypothetical protein
MYEACLAYRLGASFEDSGAIEALVVFDGVAVLDDAFGATEGRGRAMNALLDGYASKSHDILVGGKCIWMYLNAHRSRRVFSRSHFV